MSGPVRLNEISPTSLVDLDMFSRLVEKDATVAADGRLRRLVSLLVRLLALSCSLDALKGAATTKTVLILRAVVLSETLPDCLPVDI